MIILHSVGLKLIGLALNASKAKKLYTWMQDIRHDLDFIHNGSDIVEILDADSHHRHLGNHLSIRFNGHAQLEVNHRLHQAWGIFQYHKLILVINDILCLCD